MDLDEWWRWLNEESDLELAKIDGVVPFLILCAILFVAFVFSLVAEG